MGNIVLGIKGNLPLHCACEYNAPVEVFVALLTTYPEAAQEKNAIGQLPLHLACESKAPVEVITALLTSYPEAAREKDARGQLPLPVACEGTPQQEVYNFCNSTIV